MHEVRDLIPNSTANSLEPGIPVAPTVLSSTRARYAAKLILAALALTVAVGCPPQNQRVIETLPPPAYQPIEESPRQVDLPPPKPYGNLSGKRVMIDPGHGGKDPGAWKGTRSRMPEKSIVLDIGNHVAENLKARGAQVICTRTGDTFPSLEARANAADRYKVDLFVSIHADSAANKSASGTEVHIHTSPSGDSMAAARCMVAALQKANIECRGIQRNNFHVLREHSRPAMLIETGFLTNLTDARWLNDANYRNRLAAAIADGVASYLSR
jgi:N-acetylmuramoyl-L-alanine amidase